MPRPRNGLEIGSSGRLKVKPRKPKVNKEVIPTNEVLVTQLKSTSSIANDKLKSNPMLAGTTTMKYTTSKSSLLKQQLQSQTAGNSSTPLKKKEKSPSKKVVLTP